MNLCIIKMHPNARVVRQVRFESSQAVAKHAQPHGTFHGVIIAFDVCTGIEGRVNVHEANFFGEDTCGRSQRVECIKPITNGEDVAVQLGWFWPYNLDLGEFSQLRTGRVYPLVRVRSGRQKRSIFVVP